MTDLRPRSRTVYVINLTVDGVPVSTDPAVVGTAQEAAAVLDDVLDTMAMSGMTHKDLNRFADGSWEGEFRHYGVAVPSLWHATYCEQSIDE